jgi:hypothetical protein
MLVLFFLRIHVSTIIQQSIRLDWLCLYTNYYFKELCLSFTIFLKATLFRIYQSWRWKMIKYCFSHVRMNKFINKKLVFFLFMNYLYDLVGF